MQNGTLTLERVYQVFKMLNMKLLCEPAILVLGIVYCMRNKNIEIHTQMFTVTLLIKAQI